MSILKAGDGLLGTHVTWDTIEELLRDSLNTNARFGPNKAVRHLGEGNGFLSMIAKIDCDWQGEEEDEELPNTVAVKIASGLSAQAFEKNETFEGKPEMLEKMWCNFETFLKATHNFEADIYSFFNTFSEPVAVPKCFYTMKFENPNDIIGQVALEFLDGASCSHLTENLSVESVKMVAREIGKIQAIAHRHGVTKIETFRERDLAKAFWSTFEIQNFVDMVHMATKLPGTENMKELVDKVAAIVPDYFKTNIASTLHKQLQITPVLVHGDLWSANVMTNEDGSLRAIVDWQMAHLGCAAEDIIRLSISMLSNKDRRKYCPVLLETMYRGLLEHMEGEEPPYTMEELQETYEILLPHCSMMYGPFIVPVFMGKCNSLDISEEERKRQTDVIIDKTRGIFEDIVRYSEDSKKHRRDKKYQLVWKEVEEGQVTA